MTHGSLFSGIGGFELAAEWMGWENVFSVEVDPFCLTVLDHHFPNTKKHGDIHNFSGTKYQGQIDIITGGFPCQPFSAAGKKAGTTDNRYLWPEMFRVIREVGPRWIVAENVRGLVNWSEGMVFDTVCADLESEGFEVFPTVLPAASVNAPHRRDRVWIIAHRDEGCHDHTNKEVCARGNAIDDGGTGLERATTNPKCDGGSQVHKDVQSQIADGSQHLRNGGVRDVEHIFTQWDEFPSVSAVCGPNDGVPDGMDGVTFSAWRRDSIKAFGNAIVPQVAFQIFQAIEASSK